MKLQNIEIILGTAVFLFALTTIYSQGMNSRDLVHVHSDMGAATLIYATFMAFCIWIVPSYFRQRRIELGLVLTLALFFLVWLGLASCLWRLNPEQSLFEFLGEGRSIGAAIAAFLACFAYEGIKRLFRYLKGQKNPLTDRILKEVMIVFGTGTLIFFLLMTMDDNLGAFWLCTVPYVYTLFAICTYWLIPQSEKKRDEPSRYILLALLISFVVFIPFGVLFLNLTLMSGSVYFVMWFCLTLVVLPLSYYFFHRQKERIGQLVNLKIELGQTSAGLHFLRSQINPHFLFNILNTLYGTALQEKAERTSSGIQKLGDMMRFMLHENNQDRILMAREIDYLNNYIELQQLRTDVSAEVSVACTIEPVLGHVYIAPMLLIPFVENAFKHGISLREKSWIRISLKESEGVLYFDVHNSIHRKSTADPEYQQSGIGLENVRQRLHLLYPQRHELVVRETAGEYFVHLTIQL